MSKQIILNCMPPASVHSPSPALSILKAYLSAKGFSVKIIYWNILLYDLENEFLWGKREQIKDSQHTLLYAAYFAVKNKNEMLRKEVKAILQSIQPIMLNENNTYFDEHIDTYVAKLHGIINKNLSSIDFDNVLYFGFSLKMNQWILSAVLASQIKKREINMPIVVGGINSAAVATTFLKSFEQFDIAIWGEGEHPLNELTKFLLNCKDYSLYNVSNSCCRLSKDIIRTFHNNRIYFDLSQSNIYPDFNDYFIQRTQANLKESIPPTILLEGGRGCHWNRCHFCYLNAGYKHRLKSCSTISQELRYMIATHKIYRFEFLDNDIIGNDFERFHFLLHEFIKIKEEYPDFQIVAVEIITKGLSLDTMKLMAKAGISAIQIGYESASNNLLKKIDKKNTFASNLNTVKHCFKLGIRIAGANIIQSLLEETDEDIYESIENIRFYRFFVNPKNGFIHIPTLLGINSSSRYFKESQLKKESYQPHLHPYQIDFFNRFDEETQWHLFEFNPKRKNHLWNCFFDIQYHYIQNKYTYEITKEEDKIIYKEFYNDKIIENIEFDSNDLALKILKHCYSSPISLNVLHEALHDEILINVETLKNQVDHLFQIGLVYRTQCYSEIVSVVCADK